MEKKSSPAWQYFEKVADAEEITALLTEIFARDILPFAMVEGRGFRKLLNFLEPEYRVPSHQTFIWRINKMYAEVKDILTHELQTACDVAITTETWTSVGTNQYITVTVHHITDDWKLKSDVLETCEVNEPYNAENLTNPVKKVISDWELEGKIIVRVLDKATVGNLFSEWEDVPCFAQTFQLAINTGFSIANVSRLIQASGRLVKFFNTSARAMAELEYVQENLGVVKHRLIQSCRTRWNSVYEMLERLLEQKRCVQAVLCNRNIVPANIEENLSLSPAQWTEIDTILPVLKFLDVVTTALCAKENVSISCTLPIVTGLLKNFLMLSASDGDFLRIFKSTVADELNCRFLQDLHANFFPLLAACFDPRHKNLKFLTGLLRQDVHSEARSLVRTLEPKPAPFDNSKAQPPPKKSAMVIILGDDYFKEQQSIHDEFTHFLEESPLHPQEDPLSWWRINKDRFPNVAKLAKRYLSAPATSIPAERVFSDTNDILVRKRCSLNPEYVNLLVFLHNNLDSC